MTTTNPMTLVKLDELARNALVNPMIDSDDGSTYKVQSVLNFLQKVLSNDSMTLDDPTETFGLAVIIDTCAAALRRIDDERG